jgi:hypothetical protein
MTEARPEASINAEVISPRKRCPGGYSDGAQVDLGRYWYECKDGQLMPKGCMTDDGRRIDVWQTYDSNKNYRMQCVSDPSGYLAFSYKSCIYDGSEHAPGEQWDDGKYWYTCTKEGDYLHIAVSGCVDEGRRVNLNEKVTKGSFVYQCKSSVNGTCSMCPVACNKEGREYAIGESFPLGDFWYTCTNSDKSGPISVKAIGCVNNNQRLQDGDRYHKSDVVYECTIREDSAEVRPVGCVQRDESGAEVERRLGCYWTEGPLPTQYEMTCKYDATTKLAVKVPYRCMYKVDKGAYTMLPGCYQIVDKQAVACEKSGADAMNLRTYPIDSIGDLTSRGLRFC